jgi:hypothetical protein
MRNTIENTPDNCHDCHQLDNCHQAQNMHPNTKPVLGYVDDCEVYCKDCLDVTDLDGEDFLEYFEPYEGESDSPTHCGGCRVPIIHDLTIAGVEYVREALSEGGGCCDELWPIVWADYLDHENV